MNKTANAIKSRIKFKPSSIFPHAGLPDISLVQYTKIGKNIPKLGKIYQNWDKYTK
jgi:hypothetical protein